MLIIGDKYRSTILRINCAAYAGSFHGRCNGGGWVYRVQNGVSVISYAAFSDAANFNGEKMTETPPNLR